MVADAISIINADYSSSSFRVTRVTIGPRTFRKPRGVSFAGEDRRQLPPRDQGHDSPRPARSTKASGSWARPASRYRERSYVTAACEDFHGDELQRRLSRKNRHNIATMGLYLLIHWANAAGLLLIAFATIDLFPTLGRLAIAIALMAVPVFQLLLLRSRRTGLHGVPGARSPKLARSTNGNSGSTSAIGSWCRSADDAVRRDPAKGLAWRLLGLRIGRRLFDDGCTIIERTMVAIGDDCTLNAASVIQPHSQEDGGFKSNRIAIGSGCTLGVNSWSTTALSWVKAVSSRRAPS